MEAMTKGQGKFCRVQGKYRSTLVQFGSSPPRHIQGLPKKRTRDGWPSSLDDVLKEANQDYIGEVSRDVTLYRKGSEPMKARRVSYWDRNILGLENNTNAGFDEAVDATSSKGATEEMEGALDKNDTETA